MAVKELLYGPLWSTICVYIYVYIYIYMYMHLSIYIYRIGPYIPYWGPVLESCKLRYRQVELLLSARGDPNIAEQEEGETALLAAVTTEDGSPKARLRPRGPSISVVHT